MTVPAGPQGTFDPRFRQPKRLFFGIGAQKAATTWLDAYLRGHPEVCLPLLKEVHYWTQTGPGFHSGRAARVRGKADRIRSRGFLSRLFESREKRQMRESALLRDAMHSTPSATHSPYADVLFQAYQGQPVAGEITPAYALLSADDFATMMRLAPDVRFIFQMRDPFDRLQSGIRHDLRKLSGAEFDEAVLAHIRRTVEDHNDPAHLKSRYDLTIPTLESVVPADRILYLFYETMFTQDVADRITRFLGISPRPAPLAREIRPSETPKVAIPPDLVAAAVASLAPSYAFVRERFGSEVPAAWRPGEKASAAVTADMT